MANPGDYSITVTEGNANCSNQKTIKVFDTDRPEVNLGDDLVICEGESLTLENKTNALGEYKWEKGGVEISNDETITLAESGNYGLTVFRGTNDCSNTDSIEVTVLNSPIPDLGPNETLCEGDQKVLRSGINGDHSWSNGETSSEITVKETGEYFVSVSKGDCTGHDTIDVVFNEFPNVVIPEVERVIQECLSDIRTHTFYVSNVADYSYLWSPTGDTTSFTSALFEGEYNVQISNGDCKVEKEFELIDYCPTTLFVPNSFTPNGDGLNDGFGPKGNNVLDFRMDIFNRWGELIFTSFNLGDTWDAMYVGRPVQEDVYVWRITYSESSPSGGAQNKVRIGRVSVVY